jgi:WD40 repeat protein
MASGYRKGQSFSATVLFICAALLISINSAAADPPVTAMAIAPDRAADNRPVLVTASQAGVAVRLVDDPATAERLPSDLDHVHDVEFSPDGRRLAVAGGDPSEFGVVELYSWPDRKQLLRFDGHDDVIMDVAFSPDGLQLATAGMDTTARLVDAQTGQTLQELAGHSKSLTCVQFLPDGKYLVTGSLDHSLRVWNLTTGQVVRTLNNHTQPVTSVALKPQPDSTALPVIASAGRDRTVRFWQPTIGRMMRFARLPEIAQAITWTPDGNSLLAACRDGRVRAIDPVTLQLTEPDGRQTTGWLYSLAVSPDAKQIFTGDADGSVVSLRFANPAR